MMQAGILAAAGIISRIIGLLYRGPLTAIIGDEGNGYYTSAFNIYTIILLISSYSIPGAVSKVIAQKLAVKEYKNAHRIFICSLWYVIAVGGVASLFVFFFGNLLVKGAAVTVLKVFAPTIFFSGILGVLRGYFQAHRSMLQTSVSQIVEQILNAVVSIFAAYLFINIALGSLSVYKVDADTGKVLFSEGASAKTEEESGTGEINDVLGLYGDPGQDAESGGTGGSGNGGGFTEDSAAGSLTVSANDGSQPDTGDSNAGQESDKAAQGEGESADPESGQAAQKNDENADWVSGNDSMRGSGANNQGGGSAPSGTESALSQEQQEWNTRHAMYGAAGSALGTGMGVLIALLFMYGMYLLNRRMIYKRIERDRNTYVDSYGEILKMLLAVVTPFLLSTAIYNFSTTINQTIYTQIMMGVFDMPEAQAYTLYGIYGGKTVVISNIPIALASAISSAILPGIASYYARKELKQVRKSVSEAIKTTMLIAIPAAVGLAVLAKPITQVLFPQKESLDMAAGLLTVLAVSVIFYTLSTLTNAVLQGIGKVNVPVINAAIALLLQTAVVSLLLLFTDLGLYALVIANIIYSASMCFLNGHSVRKYLKYRQDLVGTYLLPLLAALFMGAAAWGVYYGMKLLVPSNLVCLAAAVLIAVLVYFVLVIKFGGLTEEEMLGLPKGRSLLALARKLHLVRF